MLTGGTGGNKIEPKTRKDGEDMDKKYCIFDMDGTLTDTQSVCVRAWDYAGGLQGFKNAGESIKHVLGMNKEGWEAYLAEHFEGIDLLKFDTDMRKFIIDYGKPELKKGAVELLEFLKQNGVKMAVASAEREKDILEKSKEYHNIILKLMADIRKYADSAEAVVPKDYWPYPSYGDLLFKV